MISHQLDNMNHMSLMFLPYFDTICDLLLNKHMMTTWNLFVLHNDQMGHHQANIRQAEMEKETAACALQKS